MKLLLIDEYALSRELLVSLIERSCRGAEVAEVRGFEDGLHRLVLSAAFDVIVVNLMAGRPGVARELEDLCTLAAGVPVLVISASERIDELLAYLASGVARCVSATATPDDLLHAVHALARGGIEASGLGVLDRMLNHMATTLPHRPASRLYH